MDMHIGVEPAVFRQWEQCQLNGGGKAAGVGNMLGGGGDALAVQFRQTVHEIVHTVGDAEILRKVDDTERFGNLALMLFEERLRESVRRAEKQHIDFAQRRVGHEHKVGFADESLVHAVHAVSGVAGAAYPFQFHLRVANEKSGEFAGGVAGATYDTCFNHRSTNPPLCRS